MGKRSHKNRLYLLGSRSKQRGSARESVATYGVSRKPTFISLFSGALGLDLGLEAAGLEAVGCLESDKWACQTIRHNRPNLALIADDIRNWSGKELLAKFGRKRDEVDVIVGGPPCPSFSTAGRRKSFQDPRGLVMFNFLEIVEEIRPAFFVMENVRGILSASIEHVPLAQRANNGSVSRPEQARGSVLRHLHALFKKMGYMVTVQLVNAADYGVPQKRERVVFLGSRDGFQITMPPGDFSEKPSSFERPWKTLGDALEGLEEPKPQFIPLSESRTKYLRLLSAGQNWRNLPKKLIPEAMGGAYSSSGGKVGFYRRLSFSQPCPTVPTSPIQKSTCLCHPIELRPLSVREYARVQQFPDEWTFCGPLSKQYMQIGNAVPVGLGFVIGKTILRHIENFQEP